MNSPGKIDVLAEECDNYKLDIVALTELHWPGQGKTRHGKWEIIHLGPDSVRRERTVGLMLSPTSAKALLSYECISDRLMTARFNCRHTKFTIIVCYAPTNSETRVDDVADKDAFYNQLDDLASNIPKHDVQIIIGDRNAQLGSDIDTWHPALGKHAEGYLNDNGIRLLSFCQAHNLVVGSSLFPHKRIHKLTWNSPDGRTINQIDHTVVNRKWRNSLNDVRVHRGADVGSDHNLAITTVQLSLAAVGKQKRQAKFDSGKLKERDILKCFDASIGGRFQALAELDADTADINEEWSHFTSAVNTAATEHLGLKKKKQVEWITSQSRELIKKRKEARTSIKAAYRDLNRETRASLRNDKKAWFAQIADDLETASKSNNMREVYQMKNTLIGKTSKKATQIRDSSGNIIKDESSRLKRWAEYFEELLNADEPEKLIDFSNFTPADEIDIGLDPPSREELDKAISMLNRNKAPGIDNIPPELLKDGGNNIREWLLRICRLIWYKESTPDEWGKGIILPLPKKGDLSFCNNNRGITLLDIAGKVFSTIQLMRVKEEVDIRMRENQAGFRKGRSCSDQIFSLNQVIEKCLDQQLPCFINFIDFKAAFDSVHRPSLWEILKIYGIPSKIINLVKNSYRETTCAVRAEGAISSWFQIVTGVRQGDIWSPLLFGLAIDFVMRAAVDANNSGLILTPRCSSRYPEVRLPDLDYADDIALFEDSDLKMANTTEAIRATAGKLGLKMSFKKTEILPIGHSCTTPHTVPLGDEGNIKVVQHFKYLGAYCSADGTNTKELNHRVGKAAGAFRELDMVWKDRYINLNTKMKFYNACVLSTLLYGAECWSLTERDEARLDAFDMRCQRKILRITWLQHKTNHYVRSLTKQPQLTNIIRNRRLKWFGHVLRMDPGRIPRTLYLWKPTHGKRKRGRPRTMWKDVIQRDLKTLGFDWSVEEAEVATQDRALWRFLVGQAASAEMHDANR